MSLLFFFSHARYSVRPSLPRRANPHFNSSRGSHGGAIHLDFSLCTFSDLISFCPLFRTQGRPTNSCMHEVPWTTGNRHAEFLEMLMVTPKRSYPVSRSFWISKQWLHDLVPVLLAEWLHATSVLSNQHYARVTNAGSSGGSLLPALFPIITDERLHLIRLSRPPS